MVHGKNHGDRKFLIFLQPYTSHIIMATIFPLAVKFAICCIITTYPWNSVEFDIKTN